MTAKDWKTEGIRVVTPMGRTLDTPDTRGDRCDLRLLPQVT